LGLNRPSKTRFGSWTRVQLAARVWAERQTSDKKPSSRAERSGLLPGTRGHRSRPFGPKSESPRARFYPFSPSCSPFTLSGRRPRKSREAFRIAPRGRSRWNLAAGGFSPDEKGKGLFPSLFPRSVCTPWDRSAFPLLPRSRKPGRKSGNGIQKWASASPFTSGFRKSISGGKVYRSKPYPA